MYMFFYSNLVYFFFIIYVQHYPKPFYIKYYKIICALHGQLTSNKLITQQEVMMLLITYRLRWKLLVLPLYPMLIFSPLQLKNQFHLYISKSKDMAFNVVMLLLSHLISHIILFYFFFYFFFFKSFFSL